MRKLKVSLTWLWIAGMLAIGGQFGLGVVSACGQDRTSESNTDRALQYSNRESSPELPPLSRTTKSKLAPGLHAMTSAQIDTLLREVSATVPELARRLAIYSGRAHGTPYALFCLGEGPEAKYDQGPLLDFTRVDCMTFCEQILAMAISTGYDEMFANLQRIRYREGLIDIRTRNHYTLADWLPNNAWLLADATEAIGGELCREMTKTIDRKAHLRGLSVPDSELTEIPPPQTLTIKYVPEEHLALIKDRLIGGEVVSIVTDKPGIFSAHMGFIIRAENGSILFRHASSKPGMKMVVDELFAEVVEQLKNNKSRVGMVFMRVQLDLQ